MKYIRTKDGRIVEVEEHMMIKETTIDGVQKCFRLVYKDRPFTCVLRGDEDYIIKQADTIEELCDELVVHNQSNDGEFYPKHFVYKNKWETILQPMSDYQKSKGIEIYGAIWTDKGLIYVAKMNDKGELELL